MFFFKSLFVKFRDIRLLDQKEIKVGTGRAFCSETGSFCLKNKSGIFENGIIDHNESKERTFLFLMVLM